MADGLSQSRETFCCSGNMLGVAVFALGVVASVSCQGGLPDFLLAGKCADVSLQPNFDVRKYAGRWFMTEITENPYLPLKKCVTSKYDLDEEEHGFRVTTSGLDVNWEHKSLQGNVSQTSRSPSAHLHLDFPGVIGSPYKVIETDYENYSCVYSCIDWSGYKTEFGFVFSRTQENWGHATEKCSEVFKKNGVDFNNFVAIPQSSDCYN
ncbi:crustacyanin-A2 subunit-like [Palaemon carinicauda]|uniref:crustacyanin-A2 subunit-like n=1 Tax=Palaemon carinicauda TaxID=392227 RepID=UPI0035B65E5B